MNYSVRSDIVKHAYDDWLRLMKNGLTAKEAREDVERDYELVTSEVLLINSWMLNELEKRVMKA